jgi:hypothetical protein
LDHESRLRHASYFHPIQRAPIERIAAASIVISAIIRHPPTPRAVESWKSPSTIDDVVRRPRDDDVDLHPGLAIECRR